MSVNMLYSSAPGRLLMKLILKSGALSVGAKFMHSRFSKPLIRRYIRKNSIDMSEFRGQSYNSFAEFFGRSKKCGPFDERPEALLSPCDSLLTVYPVEKGLQLPIKDSLYRVTDLIPDGDVAKRFKNGMCLVFRLCASDYHHFCYIDDCYHHSETYIEGELHSVQPIACDTVPVYRLNRRMWSLMDTENFGTVAHIEIGAMMVGGIIHDHRNYRASRGEEMGRFDLAGSTIVLMLGHDAAKRLRLNNELLNCVGGYEEVRVKYGQTIGTLIG